MEEKVGDQPPDGRANDEALRQGQGGVLLAQGDASDDIADDRQRQHLQREEQQSWKYTRVNCHAGSLFASHFWTCARHNS